MKFLKIKFFVYGPCFFVSCLKNLCLVTSWRVSSVFSLELGHATWRALATNGCSGLVPQIRALIQPLHFTPGFVHYKFKKGFTGWLVTFVGSLSSLLPFSGSIAWRSLAFVYGMVFHNTVVSEYLAFLWWLDTLCPPTRRQRECSSYNLAPGYHFHFILLAKQTTKAKPDSRMGSNKTLPPSRANWRGNTLAVATSPKKSKSPHWPCALGCINLCIGFRSCLCRDSCHTVSRCTQSCQLQIAIVHFIIFLLWVFYFFFLPYYTGQHFQDSMQ